MLLTLPITNLSRLLAIDKRKRKLVIVHVSVVQVEPGNLEAFKVGFIVNFNAIKMVVISELTSIFWGMTCRIIDEFLN